MYIWFKKDTSLALIEKSENKTIADALGIEFTELGDDYIKARMPVDERTRQPYGYLHGGASCVLAETVGSLASALVIDHSKQMCLGLEINANHIRSASQGFVEAVAMPLHLGGTTHVWDIRIYDDLNKLICVSRLTVAIIPKKTDLPIRPNL